MTIINVWWILKINTLIKRILPFTFVIIFCLFIFHLNVVIKFVSILYVLYNILFWKNTFCLYLSQKMLFKTVELFQKKFCVIKKNNSIFFIFAFAFFLQNIFWKVENSSEFPRKKWAKNNKGEKREKNE